MDITSSINPQTRTLGTALDDAKGRPSGFDYLRLSLSILVVISHTTNVTYGMAYTNELWESGLGFFLKPILAMFFLLSGFLVAGSLLRCRTLISFLSLRALRIYPALTMEVLLSAFLIGPLVTTVAMTDYFTDAEFYSYLVNVTGHISYNLPGVFLDNPTPRIVNQQLWTVKYELYCYIALAIAALFGIKRNPKIIFGAIALLTTAILVKTFLEEGRLAEVNGMPVPGKALILYFMAGVALYLYRYAIPYKLSILAVCCVSAPSVLFFLPAGDILAIPLVAYATAAIGVTNWPRIWVLKFADCSYGVFLYGYVIQQAIVFALPDWSEWYWNAVMAVPLSVAVGILSWKLIEEPIMRRKNAVFALEAAIISAARHSRSVRDAK